MVANGCTMVQIQCTMIYHNVPWYNFFVPCLHHGNTRMYHGTFAIYHGSTRMYHGAVTLYHGIPLFTVVYHGCTMVVPWYFFIRVHTHTCTDHKYNMHIQGCCEHSQLVYGDEIHAKGSWCNSAKTFHFLIHAALQVRLQHCLCNQCLLTNPSRRLWLRMVCVYVMFPGVMFPPDSHSPDLPNNTACEIFYCFLLV